jgi:regulator of sigma E protease
LTIAQPGIAWTIFSFLLVIAPLIFLHELGHYWVARWFGVKADIFSIGFGREIAGWTDRRGTRWKIGWLPLGGYVRFAGDMDVTSRQSPEWLTMPAEQRARTFVAKPIWQRFLIVAAGPLTNFLIAILIIAAFAAIAGEYVTPPVVNAVQPNSAAAAIGLVKGDRITAIDGRAVASFEDLVSILQLPRADPVRVEFLRQGKPIARSGRLRMELVHDQFGNQARRAVLGVGAPAGVVRPVSPLTALGLGFSKTGEVIGLTAGALKQIVVGERSFKELGGPLRTARIAGEKTSLGPIGYLDWLAFVSINLGFINLLPVPMLDGGHLLFYVIEAVRRRPLKPEAQEWAFRTGLAALLALMIFVTINDLASFGLWSKLGGLIG